MKSLITIAGIGLLVFAGYLLWPSNDTLNDRLSNDTATDAESGSTSNESSEFNKQMYSLDEEDSLWLVVNKQRMISEDYSPSDLRLPDVLLFPNKSRDQLQLTDTAATALEQMFNDAEAEGVQLMLGSAYRSYSVQNFYYENYVATYGQEEADRFSARPGTSEHQTGLAVDIAEPDQSCYLQVCFEGETAGMWVSENANKYGFILRYPNEKESVTGYQYEPWHYRYVGPELANEINDSAGETLEEFFSL